VVTALPGALLLAMVAAVPLQSGEVIAELRIHGNAVTSDAEVIRLAGVDIGTPFDARTIPAVEDRLRRADRFRHVEVLKRFASISDPTRITLVIIVDDGPVKIEWDRSAGGPARTVRRRMPSLMVLPLLSVEDGYGVSYGVQFAIAGVPGARSRASFPLTWGGDKRAAAELQRDFSRGPLNRVTAGISLSRRRNPFFERDDDRMRISIRGERDLVSHLRLGAVAAAERVSFIDAHDRLIRIGGDVVFDTRRDPMLARNAVFARAGIERLRFRSGGGSLRQLEARGYAGLPGQSVVVVRAIREGADAPLPGYLQPLLGGMANLRGFRAGTAVGDTLVAGSVELRTPLTSPLSVGKLGISVFADAATVYSHGARLGDQTFRRGVGGGVWFSAAIVRLNLAVAHGIGSSTRIHVGTTLTF
jgi:outer membrane protein assembly factor BamA